MHPVRSNCRSVNSLVALTLAVTGLGGLLGPLPGCGSSPAPKARPVRPVVQRDTPSILRGTIGSEVTLRRVEPILVSGYGLVVGLNGTGGGDLPDERIAVHMERQLGLMGVGRGSDLLNGTPLAGLSPRQVLRHPHVAVVVVYAAIPPGAPKGGRFDVFVRSLNNAGLASLEGGLLWSTDLQLGPPSTVGGFKTRNIAVASGPVFINPFAEPGAEDDVSRSIGRILDGGEVTNPAPIELALDNPSHSRAKAMVSAINNRFPEMPGDTGPTARGLRDSTIEIRVPRAYRDRAAEFLALLTHIQIQQTFPQEFARRYTEALKSQPELGEDLSWCLQALGPAALPFLRELYTYPELVPQMAALGAGAGLGDDRAADQLRDLATPGRPAVRTEAIRMLGSLDAGPRVDLALRDLLAAPELTVRVAAYEALARRAEAVQIRRALEQFELQAASARVSMSAEAYLAGARANLGDTPLQGVRRLSVLSHDRRQIKFYLDMVPYGEKLIYVTQQGQPRIVLFGAGLELARPILAEVWSDRLMITADTASDDHRLYYLDARTGRATTGKIKPGIPEFIQFMAHQPTPEEPEPGLGMTYSEVVGALYALQRAGAINSTFGFEEDRLRAQLFEAAEQSAPMDRPETTKDAASVKVFDPVSPTKSLEPAPREPERVPPPVPLEQAPQAKGGR